MHLKKSLTLAEARQIAAAAEAEAAKNQWNVTIAVLDEGGHLLYLERMDDAPLAGVVVAQEKARTSVLFRRPTKSIEESILGGRLVMLALPGATPIEGGLPLLNGDRLVGG